MGRTIWILNHYASIPSGRIGFRHDSFARELMKRGYEVYIFLSSYSHATKSDRLDKSELFRHEIIDGVNYISVKTSPYVDNNFKRLVNMISYAVNVLRIYTTFKRPDVILASSVHPLTWIAGHIIARSFKCRYVVEVRDLWPQTLIDLSVISEKSLAAKVLRLIERFAYRKADSIISVLPYAYKYISTCGVDSSKVVYIPNGVDLQAFDLLKGVPTEEAENILNDHKDCFTLVYAGSHDNTDALEIILDAAKIILNKGIIDIHFVLIGGGVRKKELVSAAKEQKLRNVFFYRRVQKDSIPYILTHTQGNMVSLYDLPLYRYGISLNKIYDYLASSKPMVFASNSANNPAVEAKCGLTVPACSPERFAQAVLKLYNLSHEERKAMGQNGRVYVERHNSIPVLTDHIERILLPYRESMDQ